jgi:alginate O-acetyltransferase complex protein AlgI
LAISVPVLAGFGGPMAYFALHALLTRIERHLRIAHWPAPLARLWTWVWVLAPLPLLFHTPFRDALVIPLFWSQS